MQKMKLMLAAMSAISICFSACTNNNQSKKDQDKEMENAKAKSKIPTAANFVSSPLRNRVKLELNAPAEEVWALVGDPGKMPEYSTGLQKVETKKDEYRKCTAYICYFKPMEADGQPIVHNVKMVWYEPNMGWASLDEEPNPFGLQQSLTLIALENKGNKTIFTWEMYFTAQTEDVVKMNASSLEQAMNMDIAQNLLKKFGGRVLENFVDGKQD